MYEMTYRLIYTSEATRSLSNDELKAILASSRTNNESDEITGSLVFVDGVFLQILEGERDRVLALADKIKGDGRHAAFKVIFSSEVDERLFGSWKMGCIRPSAREMADWIRLEGASKVAEILASVESKPNALPDFVKSVVRKTATLPWF
jgi:hypothetical protein